MSIRSRLQRVILGGPPTDPNGDEMVYLGTSPLFEASSLTAYLRAQGINARYVETTNPLTQSLTDGKLFVPRAQLEAAEAMLNSPDE